MTWPALLAATAMLVSLALLAALSVAHPLRAAAVPSQPAPADPAAPARATASAVPGAPAASSRPATGTRGATGSPSPTYPIVSRRVPPVGGDRLTGTGLITDLPPGVPAPPEVKAEAFLVADLDSGKVIAARGPHAMYLPASTLKTLTALTVINRLGQASQVTAEHEDAAVDGTKVGMVPGTSYPVSALLAALIMSSANDAAVALARANGGMAATTAQMNELARHLGALDTRAENTSGLDAPGQVSSVYDLALIGRAAVRDPALAPLLVRKTDQFPGGQATGTATTGPSPTPMQIASHNRLLWNYQGTIGVKNGYTTSAKATYIGAARRGGKAYIYTYLKADPASWRATADVFDWAFAYGDQARPVGRLVEPGELGGQAPQAGEAAADRSTGLPGMARTVIAAGRESLAALSEKAGGALTPLTAAGVLSGAGALTAVAAWSLARSRRRRSARRRRGATMTRRHAADRTGPARRRSRNRPRRDG